MRGPDNAFGDIRSEQKRMGDGSVEGEIVYVTEIPDLSHKAHVSYDQSFLNLVCNLLSIQN